MLGGCFRLVDEKGLPLEVVIGLLNDRGCMVDWLDFWDAAMHQGWRPSRTFLKMSNAVADVYGKDFQEGWDRRMRLHHPEVDK